MFSSAGGSSTESLPRVVAPKSDLEGDGVGVLALFVELLADTKNAACHLIRGGGAKLNDQKIDDENMFLKLSDFGVSDELVLRAGKKRAGVVSIEK